jgi:hypothetical protein
MLDSNSRYPNIPLGISLGISLPPEKVDRLKRLLVPSRSGEISDRGMESGSIVEALNEGEDRCGDVGGDEDRPIFR